MTSNRSADLLADVLTKLKASTAVTDLLPNGADDIHPMPRPDDRDEQASLNVGFAGGSGQRSGRSTRAERLVQIQIEASPTYFEQKETTWMYSVLDASEEVMENLGGGGRAPDGRGLGISPRYDASQDRYIADTTERIATIHQ